jgi:DNA modification methylase
VNQLYCGDNLQVLREHIADESVDLIYLDPPFNSKRDYNLLFKSPKGVTSEAAMDAASVGFYESREELSPRAVAHDRRLARQHATCRASRLRAGT